MKHSDEKTWGPVIGCIRTQLCSVITQLSQKDLVSSYHKVTVPVTGHTCDQSANNKSNNNTEQYILVTRVD